MIAIVWEFLVKDEAESAFQRAYGPDGDWAALFRGHPGYGGTSLLQDKTVRGRFLTIDHWESESLFRRMHEASQQEYARLDALFEALTVSERKIGVFETSANPAPEAS
ncbi:MAG TPA: antibiotic biosynthesis monooxygenase [Gemmatimonadales bacterium]